MGPFLRLLLDAMTDQLGANPVETLHFRLGDWALRFLCLSLVLTPIRILTGQSWPLQFRRMLGLFAYFYASFHLLVYVVLDLSFSWELLLDEVPKSPYILVGFITFLLLTPLAATSTTGMQKRLGKSWKKLHKLVYLAALTAVVHYLWLVKEDYREPFWYAVIVLLLLGVRVVAHYKKSIKQGNVIVNG